jgi:hypothetical protein
MKKWLGLDLVDVSIHVFVTICAAVLVADIGGNANEDWSIAMVFGASAIVFSVRRKVALRRQPPELGIGQMQAEHLADLEARVADLEQVHYRVADSRNGSISPSGSRSRPAGPRRGSRAGPTLSGETGPRC